MIINYVLKKLITNNKKVVISKIASINRCFDRYISDMARVRWQNNNYRDQQGAELNGIILKNEQLAKRLCDIMPKTNNDNMF